MGLDLWGDGEQVELQDLELVVVGTELCQVGPLLTVRDSGTIAGVVMCLQIEPLKRYLSLQVGQVAGLVKCLASSSC